MISRIIVPDLGATGGEVVFASWLVVVGDRIQVGQPLFLVETDKATVEVEAFRKGIVRELLVQPGDSVAVGGAVAIVADSLTEALPASSKTTDHYSISPKGDRGPDAPGFPSASHASPSSTIPKTISLVTQSAAAVGRILASPAARRMAEATDISLTEVVGTGRQGQILKRDIQLFLESYQSPVSKNQGVPREPLSALQNTIARRTVESKTTIPHFYASITIDMAKALNLHRRAAEIASKDGWPAPTINDICLLACAHRLEDFPVLNANLEGEDLLHNRSINIGFVVGLKGGGMLVPVVHKANRHNLLSLAAVTNKLKERAERGVLSESALSGGTFTVSNLGMHGLNSFTAIINPPQAGILALGAVIERPSVHEGLVVVRPLLEVTLSVDHRLVDGITAAQFLNSLKQSLENPISQAVKLPRESGQ